MKTYLKHCKTLFLTAIMVLSTFFFFGSSGILTKASSDSLTLTGSPTSKSLSSSSASISFVAKSDYRFVSYEVKSSGGASLSKKTIDGSSNSVNLNFSSYASYGTVYFYYSISQYESEVWYNGNSYVYSYGPVGTPISSYVKVTIYTPCSHASVTSKIVRSATCTSTGKREYTCNKCGAITKTETIAATGHSKVTIPAVEATCTKTGLTAGEKCIVCGVVTKAQTATAKTDHLSDTGTVTKEATCTETGTKTYNCIVCNTFLRAETIAETGHNIVTTPAFEATCTKMGLTEGEKCSVCGDVFVRPTVIKALGHSYDNDSDTTCNTCGEIRIVAHNHSWENGEVAKSATCTEKGIMTYTCSICNEVKTEDIASLGHSFINYVSNNDATCIEDGTKTAKCDRCDVTDTITDVGSAKGHTEEIIPAVAATCTETGLTEGLCCSVCGTVIKKQSLVVKADHKYEDVIIKADASGKKNGKITPTCSVCGYKNTAITIYYPKTATLSYTVKTYTGKALKPTVTVKDSNGKTISSKYYTVSYKNNTNVGTATVTITFKGNYSGTKTLSFTIAHKQVTGLKVSSVKTTSITLKWNKVTGAKYYKVEKSTDGKNWTTVTRTDKTSYTVKSLKAGTKYQFRVTALDSTKKIAGKSSAVIKTATLTGAPSVTLKSSKSKTATASWKKVTGASKYVVYKSTDGKKWTKVTTTTKTAYTLTKLTGGKKIYVKVTALNVYGKTSAASTVKNVTVKK